MSHYTVAVITDEKTTVDELLAPYDEDIEVAPYICRTKQEIIEAAKKNKEYYIRMIEAGKEFGEYAQQYINAKTDEELYAAEICEDYKYDAAGNEITTYNPKSKWDWYSIGGRWDSILTTDEGNVNTAVINQLKFPLAEEKYKKAERFWEVVVDGSPLKDTEDKSDFETFCKPEYYISRYKTKEIYAKCGAAFHTYAVVTPDGMWYAPGEMGWFGRSSEEGYEYVDWTMHYKERFLDKYPNCTITIVDCHI